jgi:hypothetical protein
MKNKICIFSMLAVVAVFSLTACKKHYIIGGTIEDVNKYKDMTTYQVLNSVPSFDTLIQLINAGNLTDEINEQNGTFFAPTNTSIFNYLEQRTLYVQAAYNANATFGLDSLLYYISNNINGTADSLKMYMIHQALPYSVLTSIGVQYSTDLPGDSAIVSYEPVASNSTNAADYGSNPLVSSAPQLVYFTQLWASYPLGSANPASAVPANVGVHTLCTTSGVMTSTGILNTLESDHVLFFYGTN